MSRPDSEAWAVILAAGAGRRFGGQKLLGSLRGRPLASYVAAVVGAAIREGKLGGGIAVVPPANAALEQVFTDERIRPIQNPEASRGLSSSLRVGIAAFEESASVGAVMLFLADQPLVRSDAIEALIEAWRRTGRSARPRYRDAPSEPGHPVLLSRDLWLMVDQLSGDEGLNQVLRRRPEAIGLIEVRGANPGIDTLEDLARLNSLP